jgi:hypothetical protein
MHVDVPAQANAKSALQVNCVGSFPLSVLESNAMLTKDPSSAYVAEVSTGAGSGVCVERTRSVLDPT